MPGIKSQKQHVEVNHVEVNHVEVNHVEVNIEVRCAAKSLDQRHRAGLGPDQDLW